MFNNNPYYNPTSLSRRVVYAKRGMAASSQPLAAGAGIDILKQGGNAIDAAVAAAASLCVLEPTANGIGGDAFALVWYQGRLYGLNASGPAPLSISIEKVKKQNYKEMPRYGFIPVTVPGIPATWRELTRRFGRLSLSATLKPAVGYAEEGYPVAPTTAANWGTAYNIYKNVLKGGEYAEWFRVFAPGGRAPGVGEIWKSPDHARTLSLIARADAEEFYRGSLAQAIHDFSGQYGGYITGKDLSDFSPEWVEPLGVDYRGYRVWEIPPNGQGLVCLMALNILNGYKELRILDEESVHRQIEAIKLSFHDGFRYISDARFMTRHPAGLLNGDYAAERRAMISGYALNSGEVNPIRGGTVYLATADGDGNMVSYIQSNYMGFGSGLVVPGTGIALQNRGHTFSLNPNHVNSLGPGKKTYHTIIPGFLTKDSEAIGPFGVMGGFMQPQGHVQILTNSIDFGLNPQAALDAPRWQWIKDKFIKTEKHFPENIIKQLRLRGHEIIVEDNNTSFGRGQIIWRNPKTGVYAGGTESRTDGVVAAW